MAENYSLNSRFGLNVSQQGAKTQHQTQKTNIDLSKTAADLFDSMAGYIAKNENGTTDIVIKNVTFIEG